MNRVFRYRMRPTARQQVALGEMLRDHCRLYNAALQERRDAYRMRHHAVRYGDQSAQLKAIRGFDLDQCRWSFTSQQQTLRRLDKAFQAFFRRIKVGQTPGYPRFRPVARFDTVTFIEGDGAKWLDQHVRLHGVGHVKVKLHRPVRGTVKQVSVTRQGRHWYVNVICVDVPKQVRPLTGAVVGLDRGVTHLLADSDGGFDTNPRHVRKAATRLSEAQQGLSRCKRGSNRRRKAVARVAAQHRKSRDARSDYLHKLSRRLVDTYDVIALEDLRVTNMVRRPKPKPVPDLPGTWLPNGSAAKAGLNKSILDAGWTQLAQMICYKAESAGTNVIFVPAANTSRTCHACGHVSADNRLKEAFVCLGCGHSAHADSNAARNILRLGLSLQAANAA
jgi:putative transposase